VSVNTPITVGGIDIYQSDWALKALKLRIDGKDLQLPVQPMGSQFMGILQIMPEFMLIGVVPSANAPMRLFFKHDGHPSPKLVATLGLNETFKLGDVRITNAGTVVTSGLQYKYDPGLPIIYVSFLFLTVGAYLVATPSHRIFAEVVEDDDFNCDIVLGSDQTKFAGLIKRELRKVESALAQPNPAEVVLNER
jgi:cytochrome c biogenesis protein